MKQYTSEDVERILKTTLDGLNKKDKRNLNYRFVSGYDVVLYDGNRRIKSVRFDSSLTGIDAPVKFYEFIVEGLYTKD